MRPATKKIIKELGYKSYQGYLRSDYWRARRELYWKTHIKRCRICGSRKEIHLHHRCYDRLTAELDSDLIPLCKSHHRGLHTFMRQKKIKLEDVYPKYRRWLFERDEQEKRRRARRVL